MKKLFLILLCLPFLVGWTFLGGWESNSGSTSETNTLETTITGIADTEIFIGDGVDSGTFAVMSGDATMANTGAVTIGNDKILEAMLKSVNAATDEYCLTYESTTGDFEWEACGTGTPGGATTQVQFNDGGSFAGDTGFLYIATTDSLTVKGGITVSDGTDKNITLLTVDRASTDVLIQWDEINDEIDINYPINVGGTGNILTFGNGESIDNATNGAINVTATELQLNDIPISEHMTPTAVIENLAAADDNTPLGTRNYARTITKVGCRCNGTCTTPATFNFEDTGGNAFTFASPTCATTGVITYTSVTSGTLIAGEGWRFDVTNAVSPETDTYEIVWEEQMTTGL